MIGVAGRVFGNTVRETNLKNWYKRGGFADCTKRIETSIYGFRTNIAKPDSFATNLYFN
jgi:hypothetical protein